MKVTEIRREDDFYGLRDLWVTLLAASRSPTIFLTWDWAAAWWATYGEVGTLRIYVAFDEDGVPRGIAPLCSRTMRRYGQTVRTLAFVGDGTNDSDYLDFIIYSGYEAAVMEAFCARWKQELDLGTVLLLNEVPDSSPNLAVILAATQEPNTVSAISEVPCATVPLPESWEEYLKLLRPRFRTKVRSVLRKLEERPEVQFGFCDDAAQLERLLPILFDLHGRRWALEGKPGVFGWEQKRRFYAELSGRLLQAGSLRFSWLTWNGHFLACQYGFIYENTYSQLQEGYEPAAEHLNAGVALRAWSLRELMRQGVREYDFLGGIGRHKSDWGAQIKTNRRIAWGRQSVKNALFCRGGEWEQRARDYAKQLVPETILAIRKARQEPRTMALDQFPASFFRNIIRKTAANCYLYSGLPALARPVREHYSLSVSRTGMRPRISCAPRDKAYARIFCYHRVNNDNDPFFPAVTTRLFERHVRFVSRYYRVVTLEEMFRRLEDGPPEALVALTFDDGYEDNYSNAFPILQRYGVPATIFLSTGSIDSGEQLWFEQLARALKEAVCEYIDLEIDIPRRLWLRTLQERLEATHVIVRLLRLLPDDERRQRLSSMLRELGRDITRAPKDGMLSWDQVRQMAAKGIHFGGHTVTHPFLSKLTRERAVWEVSECRRRIEQQTQSQVDYFAYPNGGEEDVAQWNKDLVRDVGYRAALTSLWGINNRSTDPMALRRSGPWEQDPAMFSCKLDWYSLANI